MKPTDINEFKKNKEGQPDPENVTIDEDGKEWFNYLCSYTDDEGSEMAFEIWATSFDDAAKRLRCIGNKGVVDGQIFSHQPSP